MRQNVSGLVTGGPDHACGHAALRLQNLDHQPAVISGFMRRMILGVWRLCSHCATSFHGRFHQRRIEVALPFYARATLI
jgi:hypothetical protein